MTASEQSGGAAGAAEAGGQAASAVSPLAAHAAVLAQASAATRGAVAVAEVPFLAQATLRADATDPATAGALARRLGTALPTVPNTWAAGRVEALWLGPDEWLVVGAPGGQDALVAALRAGLAVGDGDGAVVDVSDQRTAIDVGGPAAPELLAAGCALDLHPRAFGAGRCAQTLVARIGAIVMRRDDRPTFRLFVRSSFAPAFADWLADAMVELAG